ncbi:hypothetical protein [Lentibacillus juripiscarius]|uniref:Uncharacterized protein n=1 Tax=Lentibacillus juripiscarius TaxID=257446 RepID=A0ABW5V5Y8_9BACI
MNGIKLMWRYNFCRAMAIGIMKEAGDIKDAIPDDAAFLGVLSLDGTIKPA